MSHYISLLRYTKRESRTSSKALPPTDAAKKAFEAA